MMQAFSSPQAFLDANPKFKAEFEKFQAENEGKSVEQIARDYGIDPAILKLL
jgi:transposase-like protein